MLMYSSNSKKVPLLNPFTFHLSQLLCDWLSAGAKKQKVEHFCASDDYIKDLYDIMETQEIHCTYADIILKAHVLHRHRTVTFHI